MIISFFMVISLNTSACTRCSSAEKAGNKACKEGVSDMNWQYAYDDKNRVTQITAPVKRISRFVYEDDQKTGLTRRVTRHEPDGGRVVYELDEKGRCAIMHDAHASASYAYDTKGRLQNAQREGGPAITYGYDEQNRIKSLQVGGREGMVLSYGYDFLGRLASIGTPQGSITFAYQTGDSRVIRTLPNGIRTVLDFLPDGKLKKITHAAATNHVLENFEYTYLPGGLIGHVAEWTPRGERGIEYVYDEVRRLIMVKDSRYGTTEFSYDKLGNRLAIKTGGNEQDNYKYDWAGRMMTRAGQNCTHDTAYNLAGYANQAQSTRYSFDAMNALKAVVNNGKTAEYSYDGDGFMVSRTEQKEHTSFVPDPMSDSWRPLMVRTPEGKNTFYVWAGDTPLMSISGSDVQFLLHDHLGSVRGVVDNSGTFVQQLDYSPFGIPQQQMKGDGLQPGFTGLFYDKVAGVYLTLARAYDPNTGRFLQLDPQLHIPNGSQKYYSRYSYCGNDPVNFVDRTGCTHRPFDREIWWEPISVQSRDVISETGFIQDMCGTLLDEIGVKDAIMDMTVFNPRLLNMFPISQETAHFLYDCTTDTAGIISELEPENAEQALDLSIKIGKFILKHRGTADIFHPFAVSYALQKSMYTEMRSEWYQRQAENLVRLPAGVSSQINAETTGSRNADSGKFTMSGSHDFYAYGGWNRYDRFARTVSQMYAYWGFKNVILTTGARMSGRFYREEIRSSSGNDYTVTKKSSSSYRQVYNGAEVSKAVEEYNRTGVYQLAEKSDIDYPESTQQTRDHKGSYLPNQKAEETSKKAKSLLKKTDILFGPPFFPPPPPPPCVIGPFKYENTKNNNNDDDDHDGGGGLSFSHMPGPSNMGPSNVGGIYLRGAGEALKGLGRPKGIALDDNGRLIMLSDSGSDIGLPPLRLDDVVTIFRSVYENGAPFVSIDPNPKDPEGPIMLVRHDEGTARTYPGWILFEADRVMKAYSLGMDNVTRIKVATKVPGYQNMLDMGFSDADNGSQGPIWERFWIVPAQVNRNQTTDSRLTLFDVPLKVNTQHMVLKNGKLEPAPNPEPSPQAHTFSTWFTKSYDLIAQEVYSKPADGSSILAPVAVFTELRRIALITAIAENLRDQGVPMPSWMQDYPVSPYPVPTTTPAITVEDSRTETHVVNEAAGTRTIKSTHKQRIYGGVNLSAEDKDVKLVKGSREAEALLPAVIRQTVVAPTLSTVSVPMNGQTYKACVLPGDKTSDLGANVLQEADLVVPVQQGKKILLQRQFNSFFQPSDALGYGWSLNMPRIEKRRQPVERIGDKSTFKEYYQLVSPLGSYTESFQEIKYVPEVNGKIMVPQHSGNMLGLADANETRIGFPTKTLLFRRGVQWYFDEAGYLVAQADSPLMVIFRRDSQHRITKIEGWYGDKLRSEINIEYDKQGRMQNAKGSNLDKVSYTYNSMGYLESVKKSNGLVEYGYANGLVTSIKINGKEICRYKYDPQGRLSEEHLAGGAAKNYVYKGGKVTATVNQTSYISEYDTAMRPVKRTHADGTQMHWKYPDAHTVETSITTASGERYQATSTADGRHVNWRMPDGNSLSAEYDEAGRITAFRRAGHTVMQQQWHPNGLPATTKYGAFALHPRYQKNDILEDILITPPVGQNQFNEWLSIAYDEQGLSSRFTDCTGAETSIKYDNHGLPWVFSSKQGKVEMDRDKQGRLETVKTSWGDRQTYAYDSKTGLIKKANFSTGSKESAIEFENGLPVVIKQYDGEKFMITYDDSKEKKVKEVRTPNNVTLGYQYNAGGWVEKVDCDATYALKFDYDANGRLSGLSQVPLLQIK